VANLLLVFGLLSVANLHNKTHCAPYLNNNLGFNIKNYYVGVGQIRVNKQIFCGKLVDRFYLCFTINDDSKYLL